MIRSKNEREIQFFDSKKHEISTKERPILEASRHSLKSENEDMEEKDVALTGGRQDFHRWSTTTNSKNSRRFEKACFWFVCSAFVSPFSAEFSIENVPPTQISVNL